MSFFKSIAESFTGRDFPKSARAYLIPIENSTGNKIKDEKEKEIRCFQYWPESVSDTKQTNWQPKEIPGLSHPLYQWTSGGPREISFTVVMSRDKDIDPSQYDKFAKKNPNDVGVTGTTTSANDLRNADIPAAVAWLRQFMYPHYDIDGAGKTFMRAVPPNRVVLVMPGVRLNHGNREFSANELPCVMTQCDVTYDAFFPSGTPRVAQVSLSFAETIQTGGTVKPQSAKTIRATSQPYNFNPTGKKV